MTVNDIKPEPQYSMLAKLRGILYLVQFAIERNDAQELNDLLPQIKSLLEESAYKQDEG